MTKVSFRFWRNLSHHHLVAKAFASLILWLLLSATSVAFAEERVGRFCPDCMDQASARLVAKSMAPPAPGPGCGGGISLGVGDDTVVDFSDADDDTIVDSSAADDELTSCIGPVRRVFIVNQNTGVVYAFEVRTEGSTPGTIYLPIVTSAIMSAEEELITQHVIDVRLTWDAVMYDLAQQGGSALVSDLQSLRSPHGAVLQGFEDCPTGTALDAYLSQSGIADLGSAIGLYAQLSLAPFDGLPDRRTFINRLTGINIQGLSFGLGFEWEPTQPNPTLHYEFFPVSEGMNNDTLAFELEVFTSMQGDIVVSAQFVPQASRVAGGIGVPQFEQGATLDPCSAQKVLDAMQASGATYHYPSWDPDPSPFPTDLAPPGGGFMNICSRTFTVRVDGQVVSTHTILVFC